MREGVNREDLLDVSLFRGIGAEELAPRRDVAEEIPHLDERAGRTAGGADFREGAGVDLDQSSLVGVGAAGRDLVDFAEQQVVAGKDAEWGQTLAEACKNGLLVKSGEIYRLTERGMEVCDSILAELV